jgi:hypothetical protein
MFYLLNYLFFTFFPFFFPLCDDGFAPLGVFSGFSPALNICNISSSETVCVV